MESNENNSNLFCIKIQSTLKRGNVFLTKIFPFESTYCPLKVKITLIAYVKHLLHLLYDE